MQLPNRVKIVEVGPRDGLQNESRQVPAGIKIELIDRLGKSGLSVIEAGSFVSPGWVPQMANSGAVFRGMEQMDDISYPVLVPNRRGLDAALDVGVKEIAIFAAASESFTRKNINCSIDESIQRYQDVMEHALHEGLRVRGYVSCVLGCPYEGEIEPAAVAAVADRLFAMGCYEISLGDTIGRGTPLKARALVEQVARVVPVESIAAHFHDTFGQALANILAVLELGVAVVDSSVAGLGGCPYAKGATGNLATEDLVYMLDGMGIETGIALSRLVETAWFISDYLQRAPVSRVANALHRGNV